MEAVKFISLRVKLCFIKTFLQLLPTKRAHRWLEEKGIKNYTLLPIPDGITKHCGLVLGFERKNDAMKVFKLLEQNKFEVEDIYFEDKNKSYQILNFN
jgi:hypothetical protein